eukprot:5870462-Pyramimonas_sp.AAC.1
MPLDIARRRLRSVKTATKGLKIPGTGREVLVFQRLRAIQGFSDAASAFQLASAFASRRRRARPV